jgi:hypothetical protein
MAQQIVATQGNFAQVANRIFGMDFEEIDFSYPKDAYVQGRGVDVKSSRILERESLKSERNVERCKALLNKIDVYELLGDAPVSRLGVFGSALVDGGIAFFILGGESLILYRSLIFAVPAGTSSSDPRWRDAVDAAGLRGQLVRAVWKTGGQPVSGQDANKGARVLSSLLGLEHPAWLYGKDWLVTRDDPLYYKWQSFVVQDTEFSEQWGFIYNRLIPCGTPPGFQRRQGCDENDLTPSVGAKLVARKKVIYYLPSSAATSPNPPGGIPVPQPWPRPETSPQPTPQPLPQPIDQQKIMLIGGIAFLALMGIILIASD